MHKGRPSSANGGRGSDLFSKVFYRKRGWKGFKYGQHCADVLYRLPFVLTNLCRVIATFLVSLSIKYLLVKI